MSNGDKEQQLGPILPIAEETLVIDGREGLTSGEMIENRLLEMQGKLPSLNDEAVDPSAGRRPAQRT